MDAREPGVDVGGSRRTVDKVISGKPAASCRSSANLFVIKIWMVISRWNVEGCGQQTKHPYGGHALATATPACHHHRWRRSLWCFAELECRLSPFEVPRDLKRRRECPRNRLSYIVSAFPNIQRLGQARFHKCRLKQKQADGRGEANTQLGIALDIAAEF